jgi:hypothetical protein
MSHNLQDQSLACDSMATATDTELVSSSRIFGVGMEFLSLVYTQEALRCAASRLQPQRLKDRGRNDQPERSAYAKPSTPRLSDTPLGDATGLPSG